MPWGVFQCPERGQEMFQCPGRCFSTPWARVNSACPPLSRNPSLPAGIRRVQDLCKVLQLPAAFEDTAVSYFQRALQLPAFHLCSLEKKEVLGGCCVLVTCREHNWPLSMGTVCSLLYARQELFASVFLSLQKELQLSVPALSLADLVTTHLSR